MRVQKQGANCAAITPSPGQSRSPREMPSCPRGRQRPLGHEGLKLHERQRTHAFDAFHALNARLPAIHEMLPYFSRIYDERSMNVKGLRFYKTVNLHILNENLIIFS